MLAPCIAAGILLANGCTTGSTTAEGAPHEGETETRIRKALSSAHLEAGVVPAVGDDWVPVSLPHSYASMVVVATPVVAPDAPPLVTRIRAAAGDGFELRVARMDDSSDPSPAVEVHYLVAEEGVYASSSHGVAFEAVRYLSTLTDGRSSWEAEARSYAQSYLNPVVVGQVMSANDERPSMFWSHGSPRNQPPSADALYTGKHVAEDPVVERADEELGYLVFEAGAQVVDGVAIEAALGSDIVRDLSLGTYAYPLSTSGPEVSAVLSQSGMDSNEGGWAVLVDDPTVAGGSTDGGALLLNVDEDQLRDSERSHPTEQVAYVAFNPCPSGSTGSSCGAGAYCTPSGSCEVCAPGLQAAGVVDGNVTVGDPQDIADLSGTWCITGDLRVSNADTLQNLAGLEEIVAVGGDVYFGYNDLLTSLDGLEGLRSVAGNVTIRNNPLLIDLTALEGTTDVQTLSVLSNTSLPTLAGLPVGSDAVSVSIRDNSGLSSLQGLEALRHVSSFLQIRGGAGITDLTPLSNLETATSLTLDSLSADLDLAQLSSLSALGQLSLTNVGVTDLSPLSNVSLSSLGLSRADGLTSIPSLSGLAPTLTGLTIVDCENLSDLSGLANVEHVAGFLTLQQLPALTDLAGLENLQQVDRNLLIRNNPALAQLNPLASLTVVGESLTIQGNSSLVDISGLGSLTSLAGTFTVVQNPQLSICDVTALATQVGSECTACYQNDETACQPSVSDVAGLAIGQFDDADADGTFEGVFVDPENAQVRVTREGVNFTVIDQSRAVFEFDVPDLPVGGYLDSGALTLPMQSITWGSGATAAVQVYIYEADGVITASDALRAEGEFSDATVYISSYQSAIELDLKYDVERALSNGWQAIGVGLRLAAEWQDPGTLTQQATFYDYDAADWNRPKLEVSWF